MPLQPTARQLLWMTLCASLGCALPAAGQKPAEALAPDRPQASAAAPPTETPATASKPAPPASGETASAAKAPDPRVLDDVLAELAALGPLQPEAQQRLIDDLRKTDPAYWPMLVQTVRASLAYRRRAAERAEAKPAAPQAEIEQVAASEPLGEPALAAAAVEPPTPSAASTALPPPSAPAPTASQSANASAGQAPGGAMEPAAATAAASATWQQHLTAAIGALERQTREHPQDADNLANHVYLRLLDLTAGRRDDALRPIPGIPPGQQEYWSKQLFALSTYLDSQRNADPARRAAEAGIHLSRALDALGEQGPLVVRNLAFCTEVHSYGVLKRFEPAEFKPGQQILVYAEIENFKSEQTSQGFHTSLEARYQILDGQGRRVSHDDLPLTEEDCQNRRHDFFVRYFLTLPKTIYEGGYKLELTIEDELARKIGQSTIDFSVKEKK